jgi:Na+/H+ antiporter NhaD/arsenite permease-like protein
VDYRGHFRASKAAGTHARQHEEWRFEGLGNLFFLGVIVGAVFLKRPRFLREALMIGAAVGSYFTTRKSVHEANEFNFHPIREVAILFIGIFATMMPALDWLQGNSGRLQTATPGFFYWACGGLSSALDNAPTYVCFLKAIFGRFVDPDVVSQVNELVRNHGMSLAGIAGAHGDEVRQTFAALQKYHAAEMARGAVDTDQIEVAFLLGNQKYSAYLLAISIGAVFFGANTYIGNGPNFMVKSIADHQKAPAPPFLEYIWKYTLPFMLPMLLVVWWLFFT